MMLILYSLVGMGFIASCIFGTRLRVLLRRFTRPTIPKLPQDLNDLPTVSVCVPARNETHAMTQCLERVVACTYPKLEVIVLDDNSADNTSILIKSFAHAGVRFVEGASLPEGWLGKNHAQHELYKRASGEYILYLDVDTHLSRRSIDDMIAIALAEQASMVSVLPTREDSWRTSALLATLRHFWSIIAHTRAHPASTSNAWLVKRSHLETAYDGLQTLRSVARPEHVIASRLAPEDKYRFLISTPALGVSYEKKWRSQCETAIRLLYPFFGGSLARTLGGLAFLIVLLLPFVIVPTALIVEWTPLHTLSVVTSLILVSHYIAYTGYIWRSNQLVGGLIFPVIVLQELILLCVSVYAYSTNTVTWKDRPIRQSAKKAANR